MDIAAEETSSPLQGVKYVKPFSNFFQASKQRFANADPDSGVHLVGPMFELTACIDKEKSIQDFDAIYPESGVSFGPTICSFGLPYNDHNYALPVGLTPPTMAPHLMDLNIPSLTSRESDLDVNLVTSNETSKHPRDGDSETRTETMTENMEARPETYPHSKCLIKTRGLKPSTLCPKVVTSPTKITPLVFASVADSTAGLSEPKKALFAAWHAKAAASGGTLLVQQRWKAPEAGQQEVATQRQFVKDQSAFSVPRYCKGLIKASDGEGEYRCDLDMKVIEVPDDICVSPSKLSDLESSDEDRDEDDDDDASTVPYLSPCRSVDKLQHKPAIWSTVRCPCEVNVGDAKMQQCLNCRLLQHVECMEVVYGEGARTSEADPAQITPVEVLMDPANYVCATCLRPPFAISSVVLDRIRSAAQQRQSARALGLLPVAGLQSSKGEGVKAPLGGAQLLANATDRARQLGLIGSGGGSRASISSNNSEDRLTLSCLARQNNESTDVNRRIPSPPRASKRKQDLTTTSYDTEAIRVSATASLGHATQSKESPFSNITQTPSPFSTPASTPMKQDIPFQLSYHHHMKVYSVDGDGEPSPSHSTPTTSADATPTSSPMMAGRDFTGVGSRKKIKRSLFPDSPLRKSIGRRGAVVPSTLGSAWAKDYKEADVSVYSENLLAFIAQRIAGGRERIQRLPPTCLGRTPLCRVVMFDHNDKGLEASARLGKGEVVTEIRGNLMLLDEYEHFVDPVNEYNRYVMIYHNFGDRAIAINTAQYGNDARFIRRSCIPNCFLDHFVVCNKLRIIIRTKQELMPGVELTIPFDFDYRSCRYALKCACARSRCPVQKWCRKLARHKVMPYLDYSKFIESRLNALSKPISDDQSPATTPNSRSFSADYSPAQSPLSSAQKAAAASLSFATSASSPQRFAVSPSTKHSIPSVRLFSSTGVVAQSSAVQSNVSQTEEATPRKRPAPTPEGPEQKRSASTVTSADRDSPLPFEPIITTRRQAAQAAKTAAMTSAQSKCKR